MVGGAALRAIACASERKRLPVEIAGAVEGSTTPSLSKTRRVNAFRASTPWSRARLHRQPPCAAQPPRARFRPSSKRRSAQTLGTPRRWLCMPLSALHQRILSRRRRTAVLASTEQRLSGIGVAHYLKKRPEGLLKLSPRPKKAMLVRERRSRPRVAPHSPSRRCSTRRDSPRAGQLRPPPSRTTFRMSSARP